MSIAFATRGLRSLHGVHRMAPTLFRGKSMAAHSQDQHLLADVGISSSVPLHHNLTYKEVNEHEIANNEGAATANGTYSIDTGMFTGRSPKDKYIVEQSPSKEDIWWGPVNAPMKPAVFDKLYNKVINHYNQTADKMYVFDGYCGANPATQKKVRFITELAWQHHFVRNMFIRPADDADLSDFKPDFTIINACKVTNPDYKEDDLNSDVFVGFNIEKKVGVIGGTWYGGEMKKGIFSMMNYWLPKEGIMSMHCSANVGKDGDTALFFGLSGTGKTTLSADPKRFLIGDDEHGWDHHGVFNFEGGCYAKTINLAPETEPEIHAAIKPNALLENVVLKEDKTPDYFDVSKTQNGRVSYPIFHIPNYEPTSQAGHPKNVIFLTCDAYGVLPPVSKLTPGQAQYHFLSGYTAKVAGTERGIKEPEATFSACFGAAFLPLHPTKYADLLKTKLEEHNTNVFLVNTGWSGGAYGVGNRMSLKTTRACVDAILDGSINKSEFKADPIFQFEVPQTLGNVSPDVLVPRNAWEDKAAYESAAKELANKFVANYSQYIHEGKPDFSAFGPKL
ncbi:phosphoenolpyruvate carboxykinase [ATP] [Sphaeroforma arctica JP610]|uniref:phosphoenolpyruvate carboxykinase (ATP) n=1 Tax=Sphaeroforma arctica JP610 TaxID=667725 RepID=A0A0L0G4J9_9EUKA|nr:phosphoenolpyruvate carboxykinase [ATP] [Sphaeroforma arctica JP610]KNC83148.1 phosphoenolpyruvate carboxykinase [ATP] [Sphaeroforma arctica JP610]|eukprot:XP_014157050.1 phosphoenolpyruvate carboxykinase [ATP] [Sphaeroforma arctica JP610]